MKSKPPITSLFESGKKFYEEDNTIEYCPKWVMYKDLKKEIENICLECNISESEFLTDLLYMFLNFRQNDVKGVKNLVGRYFAEKYKLEKIY